MSYYFYNVRNTDDILLQEEAQFHKDTVSTTKMMNVITMKAIEINTLHIIESKRQILMTRCPPQNFNHKMEDESLVSDQPLPLHPHKKGTILPVSLLINIAKHGRRQIGSESTNYNFTIYFL